MVEPPFSEARSLYGATLVHIRPILALTRVLGRRSERDAGGDVHELCGRWRRRHLGLRPEELRWGPQLELLYLTLFSHVTLIYNPLPTLTSHAAQRPSEHISRHLGLRGPRLPGGALRAGRRHRQVPGQRLAPLASYDAFGLFGTALPEFQDPLYHSRYSDILKYPQIINALVLMLVDSGTIVTIYHS